MSKLKTLKKENRKLKALLDNAVSKKSKNYLESFSIAKAHMILFAESEVEEFRVLNLDQARRKINCPLIHRGTLTETLVHPREVFFPAVHARAAAVVLLHNHPSSKDPYPSRHDVNITQRLKDAGNILGIDVIDHIIFAGTDYFSFYDEDKMPKASLV